MTNVVTLVFGWCVLGYQINAQHGYISLNARALSASQVLISRYDVGTVELAYLDFGYRRDGESRWQTTRFNPTREYFAYEYLNSSTLYYFRLTGRQARSYSMLSSFCHIRTPPYTQEPPANVSAVTQGDGNVHVTWAPEPDGRIVGYLVIYTEVDDKDRSLTEFRVKPVFRLCQTSLTDIKPGSRYKVEVASISLDGEGASMKSVFVGDQKAPYIKITIPPRDIMVRDEGTAILSCGVEGYPSPKIVWRKSGRRFDKRRRRFMEETEDGVAILRIDPVVSRHDKGTYTCIATNEFGKVMKAKATVRTYNGRAKVPGYPVISQHPVLQYVEEGSKVIMNCTSQGDENINTLWYRNSFPVLHSKDSRMTIGTHAQLMIEKVKKSDEGTYECSAENSYGITFSYPAHLYVRDSILRPMAPMFLRNRQNRTVTYGERVRLVCAAVGQPVPEVWWEYKGVRQKSRSFDGQNTLTLTDVTKSKSFTCVAQNKLGDVRRNYSVVVTSTKIYEEPQAPDIHTTNKTKMTVKFRSSISLVCEATGYPIPLIEWVNAYGKALKRAMFKKNILRLYYLKRPGNYTCYASNSEGQTKKTFNIKVSPRGPGPSVSNVTAKAIDSSTILVGWVLKQHPKARVYHGVDVEYREVADDDSVVGEKIQRYYGRGSSVYIRELNSGTNYKVRVLARTGGDGFNPSDVVRVSTDPEFPEAPYNVKTTRVSHSGIDIAWDTRTPIERLSGFSVVIRDLGSGQSETHRIQEAVSNSYNIQGLNEDSEYEVQVSSWIRGDQGNSSLPLHVRTDHFKPAAPPGLKGTPINSTAVLISWNLATESYARSHILGHHVQYEEMYDRQTYRGRHNVTVDGETRVVLAPLTANTTYKVSVSAYTIHREGNASQPILVRTLVSPQPVNLQATLVSHSSTHITWEAPVKARDITAFNIYVREDTKAEERKTRLPNVKEHQIRSLLPDTRYVIRVSSIYDSRESDLSMPLVLETLPYIPPPPTNITVVTANETTALVQWSRVPDPLVVSYHVTWEDIGSKVAARESVRVTGSKTELSPLVENTNYRVQIRAETNTQQGQYSQHVVFTTLESEKPTKLKMSEVSFNQGLLSWYAPVEKRNITEFRLDLTDEGLNTLKESLPAVTVYRLTGLLPDTFYTVTLTPKMTTNWGTMSDKFTFRTLPFVPKAPISVSSEALNDTTVLVTWTSTATTETRGFITSYNVVYNPVGLPGDVASMQVHGQSTRAVVGNLKPDTSYRFQVRAETASEQGPYSQTTRTKTIKSDKPKELKASRISFNQAVVSWSAPIRDRNITGFDLQLTDTITGNVINVNVPATQRHVMKALEPNRVYKVTVTSLFSGNRGKTSDEHEFTTLPFVPKPPSDVRTTTLNDTAMRIEWMPTVSEETRRYITRYAIIYKKVGEDKEETIFVGSDTRTGVIVGLGADSTYVLRVRADTATEKGETSEGARATTLVSDRPHSLRTTAVRFNQADIIWGAPIRDRNITGFQLVVTDLTTGETTSTDLPVLLTHTLVQLYPDRQYSVFVSSLLPSADGKRSDTIQFKTEPFIPSAPVAVEAKAIHDTAVDISWTPTVTEDTKQYVATYRVIYAIQGNDLDELSVEVSKDRNATQIQSLVADTSYKFNVRADTQTEQGIPSRTVFVKTLVSDKPKSLRIRSVAFNKVQVSWYAPVKERKIMKFELVLEDHETKQITREIIPPNTSQHSFQDLRPDREYSTTVKSILEKYEGKSSDILTFRTLPYIPPPPLDVQSTPLDDTNVRVTWAPNVTEETKDYVVGYHITYNELHEPDIHSVQVSSEEYEVTIPGLTADTRYRVRVRADTPTQHGQFSEAVIVKTLASDRPQSVRTTGVESKEVQIAWYAPINARGITGFQLNLTDGETGAKRTFTTAPVALYTIPDLEPDRGYSISVTSLFGNKDGKTSDLLDFRTSPYVPKAPSNIRIEPVNDTALSLTWTPSADDSFRPYIVNYDITYSLGTGAETTVQLPGDATSAVLTSLDADSRYAVKIRAVTATEKGAYSQVKFVKTHESDKPRSLKINGVQFDRAELSWYAPIAQRDITGFKIILRDLDTKQIQEFEAPPLSRYTVNGLTAERMYDLDVTSMFDDVEGKTSDNIKFKTLPFVPDALTDVLVTPLNDTALLVEWTPTVTEDTQKYVVRYHVAFNILGQSQRVRDRDSVQVPGDSVMAVLNQLSADTSYRVRVRAETRTQTGALSKAAITRTLESEQPRGLRALGTEFDQVELSWYAPVQQRNITSFILLITNIATGEVRREETSAKTRQTISGLSAETKYSVVVTPVLEGNEGKSSELLEFQTKPFIPAAIGEITLRPINQSVIQVEWQRPMDAGYVEYISKYTVEYGKLDQYRRVEELHTMEQSADMGSVYVRGLSEDSDYRLRVRAETHSQTGPYSRAYTTTTLQSEQPSQLKAKDVHYSFITITWSAPIQQRNITGFQVYAFDTILGEETRYDIPAKLMFTLNELIPERTYGIRVTPVMGDKEGISSNTIEVTSNPYIPAAPINVTSYPVNATAAHVQWIAPDDLYARQYVIGFNVLYDRSRSQIPVEGWGLLEYYGGKQNSLVANLDPDTEYNVMVRVNTKTEKGHLSQQVNVKTMMSAEPKNLRISRVTFDQFDLTWDAPVAKRNISSFAIYLTDSTFEGKTREQIPPVKEHTFDNLTPSTVYLAEVASILESGEGVLSQPISVETMPFVPDMPTNVQANSWNSSTVSFTWRLPDDPASTTYIIGCHILVTEMVEGGVSEQVTLRGQVEDSVVSVLGEDTVYRVQVRAFSHTAEGKLSRPIIITTPPIVPDWSPDLLTATVEHDTSVRLEWYVQNPKAALDRTLQYEIQHFRREDPYDQLSVNGLKSGPTIIDKLETHESYVFRVRAYNPSGQGPWSSSLEVTLDGPDLGISKIARINRTDPYSSRTRWVQIGGSGIPITGYRVYYIPIDYNFQPVPGQRYINSVGTRNKVDVMRSLKPEQYYHVQVAAYSDEGIGRRSDVAFLPDMDYPRIAIGPKSTKIAAKLTTTFSCKITGEIGYKVYWKKGKVRITRRNSKFKYKMENDTSILIIKQTMPKQSGTYTCVLDVNSTLYTWSADLEVYDQTEIPSGYPAFTRNPSLTSVETGSNTSFICAANGIPVPRISWYKNDVPIQQSTKFVVTQIDTISTRMWGRESRLWILNATLPDMGKYVCSAENRHGTIYNFDAQLYVKLRKMPPVFIEKPENTFISPGSQVTLPCTVEGEPRPVVRWLLDDRYLDTAERRGERGDLVLDNVYYSGTYTCEATNSEGQATASASVNIDETDEFSGVISQAPANKTVIYASSVSFHCRGTGQPKPHIYWDKDGERLSREDFDQTYYLEEKEGVSVLEIGRVVRGRDQGVFSCTVENERGQTRASASLIVLRRNEVPPDFPTITRHPAVTAVARGQGTSLYCGTSDPAATVTWYKDRFRLKPSKRLRFVRKDKSSELRIEKAGEDDYGNYHCSVANQHGVSYSKRAMLYIRRVSRTRS